MLELYLQGSRESSNNLKQGKHRIILAVDKIHCECIAFSTGEWADGDKYQSGGCSEFKLEINHYLNKEGTSGNGEMWIDSRAIYEIEFLQFNDC